MTKTGKEKHIGIYIHHRNKESWFKFKEIIPYFSCKLTILSSLDVREDLGEKCEFIKLPSSNAKSFPTVANNCESYKKRMNILFNFIYRERPDLFYIDESAEIAAFVNLLGVPFVYARVREESENAFPNQLAYGLSLFNIANYQNSQEDEWYKKTPFYEKTKYHLKDCSDLNKKLFCMYLEEEVCLKKEESLKPLFLKTF